MLSRRSLGVVVSRAAHAAIDDEMSDVNTFGPEFTRRALRQAG